MAARSFANCFMHGLGVRRHRNRVARLERQVALRSKSLAEEENTDQLLNQVALTLMSVAKMRAAIEISETEQA